MRRHLGATRVFCAIAMLLSLYSRTALAATPEQVDQAIEKAQKYLLDHRNKAGTWEEVDKPPTGTDIALRTSPQARQWGGLTGIATYALLASGKDWRDRELTPAVDFLLHANIQGTYALGMGSQLANFLPPQKTRALVKHNVGMLGNGVFLPPTGLTVDKWAPEGGFYSYWTGGLEGSDQTTFDPNSREFGTPQEPDWYDRSTSQYGVLGMWALAQAGGDIPRTYWTIVDSAWKRAQNKNGGWSYRDGDDVSAAMTAAGVATLYITQDYTLERNWGSCLGGVRNTAIERGLEWIDSHIDEALGGSFYTLYGIERIGAASGRRYFGTKDWFELGADYLVQHQQSDGSWQGDRGAIPDTCFGLLFLGRGRAPVFMNKLEYQSEEPRQSVIDIWNERPRDVANLAAWVGKQEETFFNWQVVNFDVPVEQMHDAPILYIAGSRLLTFNDQQKKTLRAFIQGGGMILGNADCGIAAFSNSFLKLGKELFPKYDFKQTPVNDLLWHEQFEQWRTKPRLMELDNGVRKLMVLIPQTDVGRSSQMRAEKVRGMSYDLVANLFEYATDRHRVPNRGGSYVVRAIPTTQPTRPIRLARINVGPNPDPEPGGWERLAAVMHNRFKIDLQTQFVTPENLGGFKIAHITGTGEIVLSPPARTALKQFVDAGGTLIVDAAGGDSAFADSMQTELNAIFGSERLAVLPATSPVYNQVEIKIGEIGWRRFALDRVADRKHPQILGITTGPRVSIFFSRQDLSAGLVGQDVDGINGYDPKTATDLMAAMMMYTK